MPRRILLSLAVLAAAAGYNRMSARRAERLSPPRGRLVWADGIRLHYLEHGSGSPVLLLHGNGTTAEDFAASGLMERLASQSHRVIAFDRPGFGHSTRPRGRLWSAAAQAGVIARTLPLVGLDRPAVVVGHSWGTLVALNLALNYPRYVSGLVLIGGFYRPELRFDVAALAPAALPGMRDLLCDTVLPFIVRASLPRILARVFAPNPVPRHYWERVPLPLAVRPSQLRASAGDTAWMMIDAARIAARIGGLRLPVVILAGLADTIVAPEAQSGWLHRRMPGSTYLAVEGIGHMLHHSAPGRVEEAVESLARAADSLSEAGRQP